MGQGAIPRTKLIGGLALAVFTLGLAGCPAGPATRDQAGATPISVVAGVYPLAELARRVGLARVRVTDLSAAAADPRDAGGDPLATAAIGRARVVVLVGHGFQPEAERVAGRRPGVIALWSAATDPDPHVWLDPVEMEQLAKMVADELSRVEPAGRAGYQAAARVYDAQLGALDIDYRTSLADCARRDLVTADGAFNRLAGRYGLIGHTVSDPDVAAVMAAGRVTTVFTEPLVPPGAAVALAQQNHVKSERLETIENRTPAEVSRDASYITLMTDNLARLRHALACNGGAPT